MNKLLRIAFAAILLPFNLLAQNPQLSSLSPSKFYTQSQPTVMHLSINGKDMWPEYLSIIMTTQVMHVHFKKDGRDEVIRGSGISTTSQVVDFISTGWLDSPGQIEIYITIDAFGGRPGYRSNSLFLNVEATPALAPVINSLSNTTFKTGEPKEKYYIRIYGKNFGEIRSSYATIGGINASIGWAKLEDGVMDVWVPAAVYSKAGSYPVLVHTRYGVSNPVTLKIEAPASTVIVKPIVGRPATAIQARPKTNMAAISPRLILNTDNASRLKTEMVKGARVTITGSIADPSGSATLEHFISNLENVFVVDNQLAVDDQTSTIKIMLKGVGIDNTATEKIKKQIQDKAAEMKLSVSVGM